MDFPIRKKELCEICEEKIFVVEYEGVDNFLLEKQDMNVCLECWTHEDFCQVCMKMEHFTTNHYCDDCDIHQCEYSVSILWNSKTSCICLDCFNNYEIYCKGCFKPVEAPYQPWRPDNEDNEEIECNKCTEKHYRGLRKILF
uniref:Uncharacterized protein n=1 Tax=Pithovirus LCPAC302 TaxID=2506593 RepID=A0A481Z6T2_9VIRU|nr:MAG: hypothetical protein LCPAC302_02040 [Pithovirus LCPAC302]